MVKLMYKMVFDLRISKNKIKIKKKKNTLINQCLLVDEYNNLKENLHSFQYIWKLSIDFLKLIFLKIYTF